MPQLIDARGLLCPLPALKARRALAGLAPGEVLVVLATDPEAPVDVGALAAEGGHGFEAERTGRWMAPDGDESSRQLRWVGIGFDTPWSPRVSCSTAHTRSR